MDLEWTCNRVKWIKYPKRGTLEWSWHGNLQFFFTSNPHCLSDAKVKVQKWGMINQVNMNWSWFWAKRALNCSKNAKNDVKMASKLLQKLAPNRPKMKLKKILDELNSNWTFSVPKPIVKRMYFKILFTQVFEFLTKACAIWVRNFKRTHSGSLAEDMINIC